jgi:hypothetical protein
MERVVRRDDLTIQGIVWAFCPDVEAVKIVSEKELPLEFVVRIVNCSLRRLVAFEEGLKAFGFVEKKGCRLMSLYHRPILHKFFECHINYNKDDRKNSIPHRLLFKTLNRIMCEWRTLYLPARKEYPMLKIWQAQEDLKDIGREKNRIVVEGEKFALKGVELLNKNSASIEFKRLLAV